MSRELAKLKLDLAVEERERKVYLRQAETAREAEAKLTHVEAELQLRVIELDREKTRADSKVERVDALRNQVNALAQDKKTQAAELEKYRDLDLYIEHLNRFSAYTRTRRDHERGLMRLTSEQQEAIDAFSPGRDFLVRGGAGTGKTLVLLHAYEKARKDPLTPRTVLLTYTVTLVKYDRYLGYDPENITILAPRTADVMAIQTRLARRGIPSANIKDDSFSFSSEGLVRVSTLHSSKGVDFPVVLLLLSTLPPTGEYDEKASELLARNLIYVAMTRALDDLNVFALEAAKERPIAELVQLMQRR